MKQMHVLKNLMQCDTRSYLAVLESPLRTPACVAKKSFDILILSLINNNHDNSYYNNVYDYV